MKFVENVKTVLSTVILHQEKRAVRFEHGSFLCIKPTTVVCKTATNVSVPFVCHESFFSVLSWSHDVKMHNEEIV